MNKLQSRRTMIVGLAGAGLAISGCGVMSQLQPALTKNIEVTGASFDEAYAKAVRAAQEIGYQIFTSDKAGGTFYAIRSVMAGIGGINEINFFVESKKGESANSCVISVKAADRERAMSEFLGAYAKHAKIK